MLTLKWALKIELSFVSRCTHFWYLHPIKEPVTHQPITHGIYRSTTFSKFIMHMLILDLDVWQYSTLHVLINSRKDSDKIFQLPNTEETKDKKNKYGFQIVCFKNSCISSYSELKKLKMYSWKLKTVYWKLKMVYWKLKMGYWKLKTY